jgi:hypothetical protein
LEASIQVIWLVKASLMSGLITSEESMLAELYPRANRFTLSNPLKDFSAESSALKS